MGNHTMAPLKNQRHELFCRNVIEGARRGTSQPEAYLASGYSATPKAAEAAACRLLSTDKIKARIAELTAPAARKTNVTAESLLNQLETNIKLATELGQTGAINGSVQLMARLRGLLIDKVEVGSPGEFAQCQSPTEVADALLAIMSAGDAVNMLNAASEAVEARAGHAARDVSPAARRIGSTFESKWPGRRRAT